MTEDADALAHIAAREQARRTALLSGDLDALAQLCDARLVYRHASLRMDDRASFIGSLARTRYLRIDVRQQHVTVHPGAAVVDLKETIATRTEGVERTHRVAALDVWARAADGCWRLVARQANYESAPG